MANITYNRPEIIEYMTERPHLELVENNSFSPRQQEIIQLALNGITSGKEISQKLGINHNTLKKHIEGSCVKRGDKICKTGIYGVLEEKYGERPKGLHHAVWLMTADLLKVVSGDPTFEIGRSPEGKKQIEMKFDDKIWVLHFNMPLGLATSQVKQLHRQGILIKADQPFDIRKSLLQNELIPLVQNPNPRKKLLGIYLEANIQL